MRNRRGKAARKTKKLATLKVPQWAIRLKLYKGSILAGDSWEHEASSQEEQGSHGTMALIGEARGAMGQGICPPWTENSTAI